jgi:hypothetical protein
MRFQRVEDDGQSFYHCVSIVVDPQFIFQTEARPKRRSSSIFCSPFLLLFERVFS